MSAFGGKADITKIAVIAATTMIARLSGTGRY
jgi:hypothetical protein